MKIVTSLFGSILIIGLILSCSSSKKEFVQEKSNPDQQHIKELYPKDPQKYTKRIIADKCRIVATVINIDSTKYLDDKEAPCGKAPCYATIAIKQVLGYGSGFSQKLYKGQELEVNFKFTLSPTDEIVPDMQLGLPGLKIGNNFIADLEALPALGKSKVEYIIYRYELKLD
ncbi:MAG: hypothetical protein JW956_00360 [Calditrichaceae bacterium]|nr:hypothetical protein [Calditrichaceae bacterium]